MNRKSPYRHPVRKYVKGDGTRVDKYMRGDGKKPAEPRRVIGSGSVGGARWRVQRGGESATVGAPDIVAGLRRGIDSLSSGAETVTVVRV